MRIRMLAAIGWTIVAGAMLMPLTLAPPVAAQTAEPAAVARVTKRLEEWVAAETEIKL